MSTTRLQAYTVVKVSLVMHFKNWNGYELGLRVSEIFVHVTRCGIAVIIAFRLTVRIWQNRSGVPPSWLEVDRRRQHQSRQASRSKYLVNLGRLGFTGFQRRVTRNGAIRSPDFRLSSCVLLHPPPPHRHYSAVRATN